MSPGTTTYILSSFGDVCCPYSKLVRFVVVALGPSRFRLPGGGIIIQAVHVLYNNIQANNTCNATLMLPGAHRRHIGRYRLSLQ